MTQALNAVYDAVDRQNADQSAATRRQLVAGTAATLGGMGLLGLAGDADAATVKAARTENPQTLLNVAATAEVLATIVNTVGAEIFKDDFDAVTLRNVRAAAREELIHYNVLVSALGAKPLTKRIWVPSAAVANPRALLGALEVGDQVFINAYLLATTVFGNRGLGNPARIAAEFMGVEAVHRALARQSLGKLGNDRVFMRFSQAETAPDAPNKGTPGFRRALSAVTALQSLGFGFGTPGPTPGQFFDFDEVSQRTPTDPDLNTVAPR